MQLTGELISNIIVFAVFIYLSLLVSGKIKMQEEKQEKFDEFMKRMGIVFKILVYGGTIIFTILIVSSFFKNKQPASVSSVEVQNHQWTQADKDAMTRACILNAKDSYNKDPDKTTSLCKCVTEKFTSKYTYNQAAELNNKSQQEQLDSLTPLINACKTDTISTK